ncbi:MAG TPA: threonine--tRNA ligase [Blastocatellia bacterium]|nr:threonine--tRNA ligase [Blastocatellia bacterium]
MSSNIEPNNASQSADGLRAIDVLKSQDRDAAKQAIAAKVDGEIVDLSRPVPKGAHVEAITPGSGDEALEVYRHSSAHLLAAAVLELFPGTKLGIGPALLNDPKGGFFYDFEREERFTPEDLEKIEKKMRDLVKRNLPYERKEIPKAEALQIFDKMGEELKCELIADKGGDTVSCYTLGPHFVDFCLGPHVPSTSKIKAFKLLSLAGAYWLGDNQRPQMQRIYGTSFFSQEELDAFLKQREEAAKRDHRKLGKELDLFSIQEDFGQGLVLWHPKGGVIRKEIEDYLRTELTKHGYGLVFTPHIARRHLWTISGHEENYADSMFSPMKLEDQEYRIKPMNCPFHIGIYRSQQRSYRDLPLRYGEFGTCYRGELSGTLMGLMRVRAFTQDDAHLFCTPETVEQEIIDCVDFAESVYRTFGFENYKIELSVRDPNNKSKYMGRDEDWERAEASLVTALNRRGLSYERMEGEAAFYGPKIDIKVVDAIGRLWQLTTVQFDFNLPERFGLEYIGEDGQPHRPIMIHRALLGSMERFFGILIEHYEGKFPVWLSPVQAIVLPITDRQSDYAQKVRDDLRRKGFRAEADFRSEKIGAKIRNAQLQRIPFMLVVGDREMEEGKVAVRNRVQGDTGSVSVEEFAGHLKHLVDERSAEL